MTNREWIVPAGADNAFVQAGSRWPRIIVEVLWQRGLRTLAEVEEFLTADYQQALHDPFLYRQMQRAVDRMLAAIQRQELITVYGDYDADGVSSTAIMVETLTALGGNVDWYLPERLSEGYGLHLAAVTALQRKGTKLLVTVDCGTTNVEEINQAKKYGMDVIVLDHHQEPAVLPPADSIINPIFSSEEYPFKYHASAGVAFTTARALLDVSDYGQKVHRPLERNWADTIIDLAAIATVTDMMPLRGENRAIVKEGLKVMRTTNRPGLRALLEVIGQPFEQVSEQTIGFQIGPRLNAAGRLHHPSIALELLLTRDQDRARQLAEQLQAINLDRQKLTELAVAEALEQVTAQGEQSAYTAFAAHWSPGILGLVAGRLAERVYRPVLIMTENGGQIVGSGRSIPGFDMMTVMNAGREHFLRYGGHAAACGFTLVTADQRLAFQSWWQSAVADRLDEKPLVQPLFLDAAATLDDITPAALDTLETLGPYGIDHQRPKFLLSKVRLLQVATVGGKNEHLRLLGEQGGQRQKFIGFRFGRLAPTLTIGQELDLAVEASWNIWQGRKERQLKIIDIRPAQ